MLLAAVCFGPGCVPEDGELRANRGVVGVAGDAGGTNGGFDRLDRTDDQDNQGSDGLPTGPLDRPDPPDTPSLQGTPGPRGQAADGEGSDTDSDASTGEPPEAPPPTEPADPDPVVGDAADEEVPEPEDGGVAPPLPSIDAGVIAPPPVEADAAVVPLPPPEPDAALPPPPEPDAAPPPPPEPDAAPPPPPEPDAALPEPDAAPPPPPEDPGPCPAYVDSDLHRARNNRVVVGPNDNWINAIESARSGTEVLLRNGEYRMGNRYAVAIQSGVTVRGQSGDRDAVVIRGGGYGVDSEGLYVRGQNVTIADLSVTRTRYHGISVKAELGARNVHLYNIHVFDIGTQHIKGSAGGNASNGVIACSAIGYSEGGVAGSYINAIDIHGARNWVIRDNYIYNIWGDGSGCEVGTRDCFYERNGGPAILLWNGAEDNIVERNVMIGNFRGIALGLSAGRGHARGIVRNNFIYTDRNGSDAGISVWWSPGTKVYHNTVIVRGGGAGIEVRNSANVRVFNNLSNREVTRRDNTNGLAQGGNIWNAGNGLFDQVGNVHLAPGARAIGAGQQIGDIEVDIDGEARDGRFDVGADHFTE